MAANDSIAIPPRVKDLTGQRFGLWTVMSMAPRERWLFPRSHWVCRCDCGREQVISATNLKGGLSTKCQSCRSKRHGGFGTPEYGIWQAMRSRCNCPTNVGYANYGGRGITVCSRWNDFAMFLEDMGQRPSPSHTLERLDNGGHYEPGNCMWATDEQQQRNKRTNRLVTFQGRTLCVADWCKITGLHHATITARLNNEWSIEDALTTAPRCRKKDRHVTSPTT